MTWTAKTSYPNADNPTYHELHPEGAEAFHSAIGAAKQGHPAGAAVTQYPAEDYRGMRTFLTKERDAGFALKGNDIVSVFKHPKAPYRNVTRSMLDLANQNGGRRLDAFDTVLPHIYGQNGFRAVARIPWSEEHKPEGWNHDTFKAHNGGRPDVVFMAHDPQAGAYQPTDGPHVADYNAGTAAQHAALAHVQARGNMPAAPGPEAYGSGQLIRMANPLTIHHGTPHQFPPTAVNPLGEFNLSKMGTGEGAQAYGKGIYQAGNERVAQGYRDDLSGGVKYQGARAPFSRDDPHARAAHDVAEYMETNKLTPEQAIAEVEREHKERVADLSYVPRAGISTVAAEANRRRAQFHLGVQAAAQRLKPEHFTSDPGHLYESELHIHPDHMLDWDKPLHQHSQYVRDRLGNHEDLKGFESLGHRMNGEFVHGVLAGASPGQRDQATAARKLLDAGIPGIRYLDRQSRSAGQGTSNYVIFDPRTINIVKRNGLPAMIDAGADALRDHKAAVT